MRPMTVGKPKFDVPPEVLKRLDTRHLPKPTSESKRTSVSMSLIGCGYGWPIFYKVSARGFRFSYRCSLECCSWRSSDSGSCVSPKLLGCSLSMQEASPKVGQSDNSARSSNLLRSPRLRLRVYCLVHDVLAAVSWVVLTK